MTPITLASRRRAQAPPAWVVFGALVADERPWFDVRPGEQPPTILEQRRPDLVVWSSIWTDQPDLLIRFEIDDGEQAGCVVTWRLLGREGQLDDDDIGCRRHRLNELVNGRLRETFDR